MLNHSGVSHTAHMVPASLSLLLLLYSFSSLLLSSFPLAGTDAAFPCKILLASPWPKEMFSPSLQLCIYGQRN